MLNLWKFQNKTNWQKKSTSTNFPTQQFKFRKIPCTCFHFPLNILNFDDQHKIHYLDTQITESISTKHDLCDLSIGRKHTALCNMECGWNIQNTWSVMIFEKLFSLKYLWNLQFIKKFNSAYFRKLKLWRHSMMNPHDNAKTMKNT